MNNKKTNSIRVIGGKLKGRKFSVPNHLDVRPTTNVIRETIFNWLSRKIENATCLDCFAGSSALTIESISRHAKHVTVLEIQSIVASQIKKNLAHLKVNNAKLIKVNALTFLDQIGTPYDIVFLDPPFKTNYIPLITSLLEKNNWLKTNAVIYIESQEKKEVHVPENWMLYRQKITGRVDYRLYQR